jgi:hypothetical protein
MASDDASGRPRRAAASRPGDCVVQQRAGFSANSASSRRQAEAITHQNMQRRLKRTAYNTPHKKQTPPQKAARTVFEPVSNHVPVESTSFRGTFSC